MRRDEKEDKMNPSLVEREYAKYKISALRSWESLGIGDRFRPKYQLKPTLRF